MGGNLILTGWGYAEYVASAAAALKALKGDAAVYGMSKRRLPEFLEELASAPGEPRWTRIEMLGVSLAGEPGRLAAAAARLKGRGVALRWISAVALPEAVASVLGGTVEICEGEGLLETVGAAFGVSVLPFRAYAQESRRGRMASEVAAYRTLIDAAGYVYRNYQDEGLFAKAVRLLASGTPSSQWENSVRKAVAHYGRYGGRELLGKSRAMAALRERIDCVAKHEHARVLILGESGTGKETVAQLIHMKSPRREGPLVAFNCASVTKDLLEDRFFGHEKGAFTNAVERTDGLFTMADGGTLFLDEIGEMPLEVQALLLRVLEGGRFMRVGGREELECDVRLVTATNRDLAALVRDGKFRADLYQRLNVVPLLVPPLRAHKEDIPAIANAWWRKVHDNGTLSDAQLAALEDYDYPGNVRELVNILDRATALEEGDFDLLMREHKEMNASLSGHLRTECGDAPDNLDGAIRLHVRRVHEKCGRNVSEAAKALGVSRNTVRKYLN